MKRSVLLFAGLMALVLGLLSCGGLPSPSPDKETIVILPLQLERGAKNVLYGRYSLKIVSTIDPTLATSVEIDPGDGLLTITNLPEGQYKIERVTFHYLSSSKTYSSRDANIVFRTYKNQITIIDRQFQYRMVLWNGEQRISYSWISMVTQTKAEEIMNKLIKDKNYQLWILSEESKGIPEIRKIITGQ